LAQNSQLATIFIVMIVTQKQQYGCPEPKNQQLY